MKLRQGPRVLEGDKEHFACSSDPPPCHPDSDPDGTIYGPTPTRLPGPGSTPGQLGDLYDGIDSFPKAKYGGSCTCLYKYPNGDVCIFAYAAKLGPIKIPAPPPLCVYKAKEGVSLLTPLPDLW